MVKSAQVQDLREAFLTAPLTPGGWENALRDMASLTRSARGQLVGFDGGPLFALDIITYLEDDNFQEHFAAINGGDPDVNWRIYCSGAPLELVHEQHYQVARHRRSFELYDDFARDADMLFGMQAVLLQDKGSFFGLAALRSQADGPSSEEDREVFGALLSAVQTAVRLQRNLAHQGSQLLAGSLESMQAAVILLNRQGRIVAATKAAELALSRQSHLRGTHGRLSALSPRSDQALQAAVGRALAAGDRAATMTPCKLWLKPAVGAATGNGDAGMVCEIFALPRHEWSLGDWPQVLVSLRQPAAYDERHRDLLRQAMGLSVGEAEVALHLAQGLGREQIAGLRGVSAETIQTQIKHIYRKGDVHNGAELVARLRDIV